LRREVEESHGMSRLARRASLLTGLLNGEVLGRLDEYCGLVDSGDDRGFLRRQGSKVHGACEL
jgi:hypothetical protein